MAEVDLDRVAKNLTGLMPEFKMKLFKPLERYSKNLASPLQIHAMFMLNQKKLVTMTELSNTIKISKQQLTPIIDRLIKNGFVMRQNDENDRRSIKIYLTSAGISYIDDLKKEMLDMTKDMLSNLPNEDLITLDNALNDIYRIIHKIP